ncbi:sigma-70 family RNA polymerase sigma factor [Brevibacillus parabrevis]
MSELTDIANQKLMKAFLVQADNQQIYQCLCAYPEDTQCTEELKRRFEEFLKEIRLIKYISSIIHYTAIELSLHKRKQDRIYHPVDDFEKLVDGLTYTTNELIVEEKQCWKEVLTDKRLLDAIHKLTEKEQTILNLLFLENIKESEVACLFGVSQQAISKTKKRALLKLRKQLERS